jgi:hypothetical protein
MRLHLLAMSVLAITMSGSSAAMMQASKPAPRQSPEPKKIDVDKWFAVVVDKAGQGCELSVHPADASQGNVAVKPGWKVGWLLINRCNSEQSMSIAFRYKPDNTAKQPVNFETFGSSALVGKIKKKFFGGCPDDAPCGEYKYTVTVGSLTPLDPDIEIVH